MNLNNIFDYKIPYPEIFLSEVSDQLVTLLLCKMLGYTKYLEYGVFLGGSIIQANYITRCLQHKMKFTGIENFDFLNWKTTTFYRDNIPNLKIPSSNIELENFIYRVIDKCEQPNNLDDAIRLEILDPGFIDCKIFNDLETVEDKFDIIHIDPDHSFDATIKAFQTCFKYSHEGTIFLFDDYVSQHIDVISAVEAISKTYQLRYLVGTTNKVALCSNITKVKIMLSINDLKNLCAGSNYKIGVTNTKEKGSIITLNRSWARREKQLQSIVDF